MEPEKLIFSPLIHDQIEAGYSADQVTADTGLLLLREVDKQHPLTNGLTSVLQDPRPPQLAGHHSLPTCIGYGWGYTRRSEPVNNLGGHITP